MTHLHAAPDPAASAADRVDPAAGLVAATTAAASVWLESLDAAQRRHALWPFESAERGDWHYAPRRRRGLPLKAMREPQQAAAYKLLASVLSPVGGAKARAIMALETVLGELEGGRFDFRDPLNYSFTLFGLPGGYPWGWRIEGHHLIVNVTVAGPAALTLTPTFWGTNPARIPRGPRAGERIMREEYELGLDLARSLDAGQRATAVQARTSLGNIVTERGRAQALREPRGLPFGLLGPAQQDLLMRLVRTYVGNAADAVGVPHLDRVREAGLDRLRLAWAGGMKEGEAFYYRIHGPRLLIELDCTQNQANHIHSLWRDPISDWGRDILGEHYRHHHDED
jgi:hypothetical protein